LDDDVDDDVDAGGEAIMISETPLSIKELWLQKKSSMPLR
jgi:hypothetical protein